MICVLILYFGILSISVEAHIGPKGMAENETTTCDEFSKFARFNPYTVLNDIWFAFYAWAPPEVKKMFTFTLPKVNDTAYLHYLLDKHVKEPVNWTATQLLVKDKYNKTSLLVERDDRGRYWLYTLYSNLKKGQLVKPADVRFKQTGDNKYVAMYMCKKGMVFLMSRLKDVPPKNKIQDEAARIGYRGKGGKSYLYQGHQWMPIPEASEEEYWMDPKLKKRFIYE